MDIFGTSITGIGSRALDLRGGREARQTIDEVVHQRQHRRRHWRRLTLSDEKPVQRRVPTPRFTYEPTLIVDSP